MKDLIDRQEAIVAVCESVCEGGLCRFLCPEINALKALPSAQPERKRGRWIDDCTCSICHWIHEDDNGFALITKYNYCPNCGTEMEVDDESN